MNEEPVRVSAHWLPEGRFLVDSFSWEGQSYLVESTGREWEDENGWHALCMAPGGRVFELIFHLHPAGWRVRPVSSGSEVA
jgi:hypothetical protein